MSPAAPIADAVALHAEIRRRNYAADPWLFIRSCVWTIDAVDKAEPVKPFPVAACVPCRRTVGGDTVTYEGDEAPGAAPVRLTQGRDTYRGGACADCGGPLLELTYLRLHTRMWQAAGHLGASVAHLGEAFQDVDPFYAIPKSRRMRLSWLMVNCAHECARDYPIPGQKRPALAKEATKTPR